ncbi:MAG: hypothetical protein U0T82_12080 [Bacteroidales bacterium]
MKPYSILLTLFLFMIPACESDLELSESIFISDPDYPGLPKYTEWGYNTFGVYFDRKTFISNDAEVPVKILVENGSTLFIFRGEESSPDYYSYNSGKMSMSISIPDFAPAQVTDLLVLNDTTLDLTNPGYELTLTMGETVYTPDVLNGKIHFNRVQNLVVDDKQTEVILSGTFEFQVRINGEPIAFSDGRFDLGIAYSNFFVF